MSTIPFWRALLSATTLFGGHFLNRRHGRVALIGTLLVVALISSIGGVYALVAIGGERVYSAASTWFPRLLVILVVAVALLSAGLTFHDARYPSRGSLPIVIRAIRLPLTMFGTLVLVAVFLAAATYQTPSSDFPTESTVPTAGHLEFGYGKDSITFVGAPPPPEGPHRLRGRIMLDKAGIEGVRISLMLNGAYNAVLYSNSQGEFEVSLPAGKWRINEIKVGDWDNRPKNRNLILFSPHEPLKRPGMYSRFNVELADGLEVSLPAASQAIPIELEFRDALPIVWPTPPGPGEHRDQLGVPEAELLNAAIIWQPVKGASEYEVQIGHVKNDLEVKFPSIILTRRLSGLTLPLASLPQRTAPAPADQYSVHVFAFDAGGRLLTESALESDDRMFRLTGAARLGKEQQYVGFEGPRQVISAEFERNEEQLGKVSNLLDGKQYDEARHLLDEITEDAPRGRESALRGRLAALQGDCATAIILFDKAEAEVGGDCVLGDSRKLCEAPQP
jgi:hypothetical protein